MLTHQSEPSNHNARVPVTTFFYLGAEILLAALIGLSLAMLAIIKSTLPKPPRDLTNYKVVTILAFIPFMIQCDHSHIVAVIPTTSTEDAHMGSKATVSGIIEAIRQHVNSANQLTFTTMAPKAEARLMNQSKQQTAQDIVEAVRRDQYTLITSWGSDALYPVCCMAYEAIHTFTQWLYRQGCED
ncbi:uncharacterized protein LOC124299933 isoform X2 [Neodiprion virginianus]|uniref:uncharacterized protein LOC124178075 isoform X2 n=1 Tax=Neodiprion fabricii TaxID=2872261 RepID=UPI001ED907E8|nr:uncharacterized protein LOC124178075 isoform X2 [Neodiprion fabricii]XP_046609362.1 uncharacterized protein LOC124299933 isoform X2 [Neodiprion virginianus]